MLSLDSGIQTLDCESIRIGCDLIITDQKTATEYLDTVFVLKWSTPSWQELLNLNHVLSRRRLSTMMPFDPSSTSNKLEIELVADTYREHLSAVGVKVSL